LNNKILGDDLLWLTSRLRTAEKGVLAAQSFLIFNGVVLSVVGLVLFEEIGPFSSLIPVTFLLASFIIHRKVSDTSHFLEHLKQFAHDQDIEGFKKTLDLMMPSD